MTHRFGPEITHETAPMLAATWGSLAVAVAIVIVARPTLGARLSLAPRRVLHSVAAYLHAAIEAERPLPEVAAEVEATRPRDLLARAVTQAHPRLYKLLDRVGPTVGDLSLYTRINALLHGPSASVLLDAEEIGWQLLDIAEQITGDSVLLAAREVLVTQADVDALRSLLTYMRAVGLARDIEVLPSRSGWGAIHRRAKADLKRARALVPPWNAPENWRIVESLADLLAEGSKQRNCVGGLALGGERHIDALLSQQAVILANTGSGPLLMASVRPVGGSGNAGLWTLGEVSGVLRRGGLPNRAARAEYSAAHRAFRALLDAECERVGHALLAMSPADAASMVEERATRGGVSADDNATGRDG